MKGFKDMEGWIDITAELPETGKNVFVSFVNECGKQRICKGMYVVRFTIEDDSEYEGETDYNEEEDKYYLPDGWYEVAECNHEFEFWPIDGKVTHWMVLPTVPGSSGKETSADTSLKETVMELQKKLDSAEFEVIKKRLKELGLSFRFIVYNEAEAEDLDKSLETAWSVIGKMKSFIAHSFPPDNEASPRRNALGKR